MRHLKKFNEDILYFGDDEPKKKPFDITEARYGKAQISNT